MRFKTKQSAILAFVVLAMCVALIVQYGLSIEPCPLCVMQRVCYVLTGVFVIIALLTQRRGLRCFLLVMELLCVFSGIVFAGRQVWLQHFSMHKVTACLPGLSYMVQHMPFSKVISLVLHGSVDCSQVHVTFLRLSMADWSLLAFFLLMSAVVCSFKRCL